MPLLQGAINDPVEHIEINRLLQVVEGPFLHGVNGSIDRSESRRHHYPDSRIDLTGGSEHAHPVQLRHPQIRDDQIHHLALQ